MFNKIVRTVRNVFFMTEEEYIDTVQYYSKLFDLKWKWKISVLEELPFTEMNYDRSQALACTNYLTQEVDFKSSIFKTNPKILVRGYIRHELRHCQQMEHIYAAMVEKGGEALASIYTTLIISNDNQRGYTRSLMEADAWLVFFGIYKNIDKIVAKIIKRNFWS